MEVVNPGKGQGKGKAARAAGDRRWRHAAAALVCGLVLGPGTAGAGGEEQFDFDARMTGHGRLAGADEVRYRFELPCDPDQGKNALQVHWGKRNRFSLDRVVDGFCLDDPRIEPGPVAANFDTYRGEGVGSYNGTEQVRAAWIFTDAGEGRGADLAGIVITRPDGSGLLEVAGPVKGDHRASGNALLPEVPGVDPTNIIHTVEIDAEGRVTRYAHANPGRGIHGRAAGFRAQARRGAPRTS